MYSVTTNKQTTEHEELFSAVNECMTLQDVGITSSLERKEDTGLCQWLATFEANVIHVNLYIPVIHKYVYEWLEKNIQGYE